MTILVYRIEAEDGTGPYWGKCRSRDSWYHKSICDHFSDSRPGPLECKSLRNMNHNDLKQYNFAFSTIKQLERWFTKTDRELLHCYGYKISVYKVQKEHYKKAKNQCIFKKEHSVLVNSIDIKEYYMKKKNLIKL